MHVRMYVCAFIHVPPRQRIERAAGGHICVCMGVSCDKRGRFSSVSIGVSCVLDGVLVCLDRHNDHEIRTGPRAARY